MTRDASLDEFLGGDDDESDADGDDDADQAETREEAETADVAETAGEADPDDDPSTEAATPDDEPGAAGADEGDEGDEGAAETTPFGADEEAAVEPARSTYDWSPEGAACAACGATVEARWRDEPGLVCADCKEW